jgi:hypothetical protein
MQGMQIGVCYQLAFNTTSFPAVCQARTRMHLVIGQWQAIHKLVHSQSIQPGFLLRSDPNLHSEDASLPTSLLAEGVGPQHDILPAHPSLRKSWARACAQNTEMGEHGVHTNASGSPAISSGTEAAQPVQSPVVPISCHGAEVEGTASSSSAASGSAASLLTCKASNQQSRHV